MKTLTLNCEEADLQAIKDACNCLREIELLASDPHASLDLPSDGQALAVICREFMRDVGMYPPSAVATCIGCGCNDNAACEGGCEWLAVDRETHRGVCSRCGDFLEPFHGELRIRELHRAVEECCS